MGISSSHARARAAPSRGGLRIMLMNSQTGLFLYVRLPGAQRLLVELSARSSPAPLALLKDMGELGPLTPLSQYLKPSRQKPELDQWLGIISLVRGLALRPGGSWIFWRPDPVYDGGFAYRARVAPLSRHKLLPPASEHPPLMVMGLSPEQICALNGGPGSWVANASLALRLKDPGPSLSPLLVGGDLMARAWERLLAGPDKAGLLRGVSLYLAGKPAHGFDLARGVLMSALPWLVLGALCRGPWPRRPLPAGGRHRLATPPLGLMTMDADRKGRLRVRGRPWEANQLTYQGVARPVGDPILPPPWPVQRALAGPA